jgi:hypothetical protein
MFYHHGTIPGRETLNPFFTIPFDYNPKDFDVYAFEAAPKHTQELTELATKYGFTMYTDTAVWVNTDGVDIYSIDWRGDDNPQQGATLFAKHNEVKGGEAKKHHVPSIDFSQFLKDNFTPDDFVMLKMNIEGETGYLHVYEGYARVLYIYVCVQARNMKLCVK